mmetsp:Transcript_18291/g.54364  ORF Transcript_18291/g.54364 Transcript_18291/m.54364 type:complete len:392 (+) Transcript_18291:261-1436(+)
MDFIETTCAATPEVVEDFRRLGDCFERKLYHELTEALRNMVEDPGYQARGQLLLDLEARFLSKVEGKLNQLAYARILAGIIAAAVEVARALTPAEGVARLSEAAEAKKARLGAEAALYLEMSACLLTLADPGKAPEAMAAVKSKLDEAKPAVDALTGTTDTAVFHKYYAAASEYYKQVGPPEAFYTAALSLLSYAAPDDMPVAARRVLATDVALAAVAGEGVYNFGEVLATPILQALEGTPNEWLGALLKIFAAGDVDGFAKLLAEHKEAYLAQPALAAKAEFIKEKIALLAFMNLIFETPSHERTLTFAVIAARARLALDQVEWLAMRAMALNLVRGVIDQVEGVVVVAWVQPRVLDAGQIRHLIDSIDTLSEKSSFAHGLLADQTAELL